MITTAANNAITKLHKPCPSCTSSDAYCEYEDGHGYCFACQTYFGNGKNNSEVDSTYEFLPWRSVSADTFRFYGCPTKVGPDGKPISIGFKYPTFTKVRRLDKKEFFTIGEHKPGLFGTNLFASGAHKYCTITEGELDACSYRQSLLSGPVLSVQSSSSAVADCVADRDYLNGYERIYLAFDNDQQGRDAVRRVSRLFDYDKVFDVRFSNRKDANEYLQAGESEELKRIWWSSKKYLPESLTSSLDEFNKLLNTEPKKGVSYPFPTLNNLTYGLRTGEIVLITAQEGVGKTELCHAIEYNLLKQTDYPVGAIYLEEPQRRHLQALAGIHLQRPVHLPDCGCTIAETSDAIRDLVQKDDRLYLYSHFGSSDAELLLDTLRFLVSARGVRFVILDHITMGVGVGSEEDERRKLDTFSNKVEMMVKELDFGLIIVSHVNDFGQTRGSRYIGKVADVRIDAERDVNNSDDTVRRSTYLTVSKNRFCGRTGPAGVLLFNPLTYTLSEIENASLQQVAAANDNNRPAASSQAA